MRFFLLTLLLAVLLGLGAGALAQVALPIPASDSVAPAAGELPGWFAFLKNKWAAALAVAILTQAIKMVAQAFNDGEKPRKAWTVLASAILSLLAAAAAAFGAGGEGFDPAQAYQYLLDAIEAFLLATGAYKGASHALSGAKAVAGIFDTIRPKA